VLGPSKEFDSVATTGELYAFNGHWSPRILTKDAAFPIWVGNARFGWKAVITSEPDIRLDLMAAPPLLPVVDVEPGVSSCSGWARRHMHAGSEDA